MSSHLVILVYTHGQLWLMGQLQHVATCLQPADPLPVVLRLQWVTLAFEIASQVYHPVEPAPGMHPGQAALPVAVRSSAGRMSPACSMVMLLLWDVWLFAWYHKCHTLHVARTRVVQVAPEVVQVQPRCCR